MVQKQPYTMIYGIDKGASRLICRIDEFNTSEPIGALNEDGSQAAFIISGYPDYMLKIVEVNRMGDGAVDRPVVATFALPGYSFNAKPKKLAYDSKDKLHILYLDGQVSLFNASTRELVFIPQEPTRDGEEIVDSDISPDARYTAMLFKANEEKERDVVHRLVVRKKTERLDYYKALCRYEHAATVAEKQRTASEGELQKMELSRINLSYEPWWLSSLCLIGRVLLEANVAMLKGSVWWKGLL